jgi:dolichol-phosphate mannosyltransferase
MTQPSRVLVAISTYNEMENLPSLVDEIYRYADGVDIVVVDDNSPDGTGGWCDERVAVDSHFHVIHRAGKLGLGTATIAGLRYAMDNNYDWVVTMDADFSHHPRYLPAILGAAHDADNPVDLVIGSRYVPTGGVEGWPIRRRIMSRCVNIYVRWLLGLRPRDCSGAYRCSRVDLLRQIDWQNLRSTGYSLLEEILWKMQRTGARIREVPIIFVDRTQGRSKINSREVWDAIWIIFRLALERWFVLPFARR